MRLIALALALAAAFAAGGSVTIPVVTGGKCDWKIVCGSGERDRLAAEDFAEIFQKATGVRLEIKSKGEKGKSAERGLFLIGGEFAPERKLAEEETAVFAKDGNVVLAGGGVAGSCYAVYDFCEKYFGYRLYGAYEGAEIVKKVTDLVWDGRELSTRPKFTGYRYNFSNPLPKTALEKKFYRRNRANVDDRPLTRRVYWAQHGLFLWVPPYDGGSWVNKQWKGMYKEHPEYFSLDRRGRRDPLGQLCFSNPGVRKLFIERFRETAARDGKGIYMVGSNDFHNERYCWCEGCAKLMAKYKTNGGPLWDFILELCEAVKDMPEVYVTSLAYKGPEQTEPAPVGVTFPENFVCDAAFLNSDRPIGRHGSQPMGFGRTYNRLENLKEWHRITKHLAWWYYGSITSIQTYRRMQMELQEILEAGVDSPGACGFGGGVEFRDVAAYMWFQLCRDPYMDADAAVMDVFRHRFGPAADGVFEYLKELEHYNIDRWNVKGWGFNCEQGFECIPIDGATLAKWQRKFDAMMPLVKDDPVRLRNLKLARLGLDCWTTVYGSRVREAAPDYPLDFDAVIARGLEACEIGEKLGLATKARNRMRESLNSMKYYSRVNTDLIPEELGEKNPKLVKLVLPVDPPHYAADRATPAADPKAAAGVAMFAKGVSPTNSIHVQLYDSTKKQWLLPGAKIDPKKLSADRYVILSVGIDRLPPQGMFVLADKWGTPLDMRTLARFYDATYHLKRYEYFVSVRLDGDALYCDRVYLVDRGMPGEQSADPPAPSAAQLKYLSTGMMGIVHFGLNTFVDREWGYGDTPPSAFAPKALDAEQWVLAAKAGGLKKLVMVTKHHDGFCLFPSKLNADYTVANSPWKAGRGDLVKEVRDACLKHGLEFGAYLSPWDRHQASYATPAYVDYFHGQWDELLAGYGPIAEIWLDGANGGDGWYGGAKEKRKLPCGARDYYRFDDLVGRVVARYPQAIAFGGGTNGNCARWVGNEVGMNRETRWCDETGAFVPLEADTPFRKGGWFWHPGDRAKSLAELVEVFFLSVGRGAVLDFGLAPNRDGLLDDGDVKRLKEFGDWVRAFEAVDYAAGAKRGGIKRDGLVSTTTLELAKTATFNAVDFREDLGHGQQIAEWTFEAEVDGGWRTLCGGTTAGYRRIERFDAVTASRVRLVCRGRTRAPVTTLALRTAAKVAPESEAEIFNQWRSACKVEEKTPGVLEFDFLRRISANAVQYRPAKDRVEGVPDQYEISVSDDGVTWRTVASGEFGNLRANPVMQRQSLPAPAVMRYARVKATRALEGTPTWKGALFEFFTR